MGFFFFFFLKKNSATYSIGLLMNVDEVTLHNDADVMEVQAWRRLSEKCFQLTRLPSYHLRNSLDAWRVLHAF